MENTQIDLEQPTSQETYINAVGREIPIFIKGYGPTRRYEGAYASTPKPAEALPPFRPTTRLPTTQKRSDSLEEAIRASGLQSGMTISFHHHLRAGDGVVVPVVAKLSEMGFRNLTIAPSSLHEGQKGIIDYFKNGTIVKVETGCNMSIGKAVSRGELKHTMVVRSHGARVRAVKEGDISIDVAFLAASEADDQGNCNGVHGKNACGPLAYGAIDAKLARHVIVITDNLVEYPCTPISISENYVDQVVVVPSIGDNRKIVAGTTRLSTDPIVMDIGDKCARLISALNFIHNDLVFQAGAGGTSLTAMWSLKTMLQERGVTAKMANGGTTCILVEMLREGLVRKLTTCQAFDLAAVESMCDDYPKHVETDIDQYANPHNAGNVCNQLDIMVAGATEVDLDFNVNCNTHSDGTFQHNTGGHQDTAAGAKLCIVTMRCARRAMPGIIDKVTTVTTPGECIGAIVTEEGVAINPRRADLLRLVEGKTEEELGFKLVTIEHLRDRAIQLAGRVHSAPRVKERIVGVIEWRDGTVLDVVREPVPRPAGLGNNAQARAELLEEGSENVVEAICYDDTPFMTTAQVEAMGHQMLHQFGIRGMKLTVEYDLAQAWVLASSMENAARAVARTPIPWSAAYCVEERREYPPTDPAHPLRRSHLYIPGADPYMLSKGGATPADGVILDLEDAVDPAKKPFARILMRHALRHAVNFGTTERWIRINGVDELGFSDIECILPHALPNGIVVPKVETAEEIRQLEEKICSILGVAESPILLIPLIESPLGVENAFQIVSASPRIVGLSMGLEDYTQELGVPRTKDDFESQWALSRIVNAAATAGVQCFDSVYSTLNDNEGLDASCQRAKTKGFWGKRCINPNQCPVVNAAFMPSEAETFDAQAVVTAFLKATGGVTKYVNKAGKSKMVDRPVVLRAIKTLRRCVSTGRLDAAEWTPKMEDARARV